MNDTHLSIPVLTRTAALALTAAAALLQPSCSHSTPENNSAAFPSPMGDKAEQRIIDDSTTALRDMRADPDFSVLDASLKTASGVLIFPHVNKAALIVGGEGGDGVLLARDSAGGWSPPAFYTIGGGSVGPQLGYEEAAIVLVLTNHHALESALDTGLTLGANVSVAGGTMGNSSETRAVRTARDVLPFVDANGVFAGASLDGALISSRQTLDQKYYGRPVTARDIVMQRSVTEPGAAPLEQQLSLADRY